MTVISTSSTSTQNHWLHLQRPKSLHILMKSSSLSPTNGQSHGWILPHRLFLGWNVKSRARSGFWGCAAAVERLCNKCVWTQTSSKPQSATALLYSTSSNTSRLFSVSFIDPLFVRSPRFISSQPLCFRFVTWSLLGPAWWDSVSV